MSGNKSMDDRVGNLMKVIGLAADNQNMRTAFERALFSMGDSPLQGRSFMKELASRTQAAIEDDAREMALRVLNKGAR